MSNRHGDDKPKKSENEIVIDNKETFDFSLDEGFEKTIISFKNNIGPFQFKNLSITSIKLFSDKILNFNVNNGELTANLESNDHLGHLCDFGLFNNQTGKIINNFEIHTADSSISNECVKYLLGKQLITNIIIFISNEDIFEFIFMKGDNTSFKLKLQYLENNFVIINNNEELYELTIPLNKNNCDKITTYIVTQFKEFIVTYIDKKKTLHEEFTTKMIISLDKAEVKDVNISKDIKNLQRIIVKINTLGIDCDIDSIIIKPGNSLGIYLQADVKKSFDKNDLLKLTQNNRSFDYYLRLFYDNKFECINGQIYYTFLQFDFTYEFFKFIEKIFIQNFGATYVNLS